MPGVRVALTALRLAGLVLIATGVAAATIEVPLRAPLTTVIKVPAPDRGAARVLEAVIEVPADAPRDLGVGAFLSDHHGRWFQSCRPGTLAPGRHDLRFDFHEAAAVVGEGHAARFDASEALAVDQGGLFFWSSHSSRAVISVPRLAVVAASRPASAAVLRLCDLVIDGMGDDGQAHANTGSRWSVRWRPEPFPSNPFDQRAFAVDLVVTLPGGGESRIPAFFDQPMRNRDRGDAEEVLPSTAGAFCARFRPRQPGLHRLTLETRWQAADGAMRTQRSALPALAVGGALWDDYVRVDREDPRFFSLGGRPYWPIGLNLRSVWDVRSVECLGTALTPNRGALAYDAYLTRFAAAGGSAVEIWLSSWNLALEWRADWPGFRGQGNYNQVNAWRLDRILDRCQELGVHVNLVITNHGMVSERVDAEWESNPYNTRQGGRLTGAAAWFTDPAALSGQDDLRRYLVARYADHPALLGWKLFSEVNLTAGQGEAVVRWHEQACARWHDLDTYQHGVTTHWSGDFRIADPAVVALPGLDYVCIDAYHTPAEQGGWLLAELLFASLHHPNRGLGRFTKPVLVTEFGGNWNAAPEAQVRAEHACGAWAALVSGHAGAPMLWWFEWVDQREMWASYGAIARFLIGEDLRSPKARCVLLGTSSGSALWCRAWTRPGRMLGYCLDQQWGGSGRDETRHERVTIDVGSQIAAGTMVVDWWDADLGTSLGVERVQHAGGALVITAPAFRRHVAFKLTRASEYPAAAPADTPTAR